MASESAQKPAGPVFSVVIPLYNKRDHVRRTVKRVLAQDHAPLEVIVVDDGSTDGSVERLAGIDDPRLRILHQPNGGPGKARNLGIAQARAPWIAFIDADDAWYPDHLRELARAIADFPAAGLASTAYVKRPDSPDLPPRPQAPGRLARTTLFAACHHRNVVCASTVAVRREVFAQVGGFKAFWPGEDTDMWVRASLRWPLAFSSRVTAIYTMNTGGISETYGGGRRRVEQGIRDPVEDPPVLDFLAARLAEPEHAPLHDAIRSYRDARLLSIAKNAVFDGDRPGARAALARVSDRKRRRYLLLGAITLLPGPLFRAGHALWRARRG